MTEFQFETRNPNDDINVMFKYVNKAGREMFSGGQSFKLVKDSNGNYVAPSSEIKVKIWPSGDLPIEVMNADSVEIDLLNERGETTETRYLDRDQATGEFMYPTWLAGQQNVLVTAYDYRDDGTTVKAVYIPFTGARLPTMTRSMRVSSVYKDVIIVPVDTARVILSPAVNGDFARTIYEGRSPLVQVSYTKDTKVGLSAEYFGQMARGFWVRRADVLGWSYHQVINSKLAEFTVSPGVYDVVIDGLVNVSQQTFSNSSLGKGSFISSPSDDQVVLK
ncbi:MAG: hypothetical protein EXS46_02630 [Candidatus Taylorbacteria bacterium]|nr:hypothetical protein [Candidatus Taylorbacteria bacterium]